CEFCTKLRFRPGAVLDRRARRGTAGVGVPRPAERDDRQAAAAPGRAARPRPRHRAAAGGGVRAVCARGGVPEDRPLDAERAAGCAEHLRQGRICALRRGAARQLGPFRARSGELGAQAFWYSCRLLTVSGPVLSASMAATAARQEVSAVKYGMPCISVWRRML